jgi:hypothetical protein
MLTVLGCVTVAALLGHAGLAAVLGGLAMRVRTLFRALAAVIRPRALIIPVTVDPIPDEAPAPPMDRSAFRVPDSPFLAVTSWRAPPAFAC